MGAIARTTLQLIEELWVQEIATYTVSRWLLREEHELPEWTHSTRAVATAQQRAVEAAAYYACFAKPEKG